MIDPVVSVSLRCMLAATLAAAAWHKLRSPAHFRATLASYRLLPNRLERVSAIALPVAESFAAIALLLPIHRVAALFALALFALYTLAIGTNLLRGRRSLDCGCFGPARKTPLSEMLLARNVVLIVAAGLAALPLAARDLVWMDALTLFATVPVTMLLWMSFWRLVAPARRLGGA